MAILFFHDILIKCRPLGGQKMPAIKINKCSNAGRSEKEEKEAKEEKEVKG